MYQCDVYIQVRDIARILEKGGHIKNARRKFWPEVTLTN